MDERILAHSRTPTEEKLAKLEERYRHELMDDEEHWSLGTALSPSAGVSASEARPRSGPHDRSAACEASTRADFSRRPEPREEVGATTTVDRQRLRERNRMNSPLNGERLKAA